MMPNVLVRFFILAALWCVTCVLIGLMGPLNAAACAAAAGCWVAIGALYLMYLRKLRLEPSLGAPLRSPGIFDSDNLG